MKVLKTKKVVRQALTDYPVSRDSDFMLIAHIWWGELPDHLRQSPVIRELFVRLSAGGFSNPESIRRSRQLIQAKDSSLRGKAYSNRVDKAEKSVRQEVIQDKFNLDM